MRPASLEASAGFLPVELWSGEGPRLGCCALEPDPRRSVLPAENHTGDDGEELIVCPFQIPKTNLNPDLVGILHSRAT